MDKIWQRNSNGNTKFKDRLSMTKSYLVLETEKGEIYNSWEQSIIAPKFTLRNFTGELHYYLRIYLSKKKSFTKIIMFLFLNAVQRIFYTVGTTIINIRYKTFKR